MKNLSVLILATLPLVGFSQQTAGLKLGAKLVPMTTWMINQQDSDAGPEFDYQKTWSFAIGAEADYFFSESFGLGLELLYGTTAQKFDVFDSLVYTKRLTYLKVPLLINLASNGDGAVNFLGQFGPQVNLRMNSSLDSAGTAIPDSTAYSSATFGVDLFLGLTFNLGVADIVTGLRLDYAFTDAEDKDAGNFPPNRGPLKTATGGLVLGLRFGLGG